MSIIVAFDKICRACLSGSEPFHDLFAVCSPEVFEFCTSVEVSEGDELPRMICNSCVELLNKLCHFKQVVIKSNEILKGHVPVLQIPEDCDSIDGIVNDDIDTVLDPEFLGGDMLHEDIILAEDEFMPETNGILEEAPLNELQEKEIDDVEPKIMPIQLVDEEEEAKESVPQIKNPIEEKKRKPRRSKGKMKCVKCEKAFHKYDNLEAHMRTHFGKLPDIKCTECGKLFTTLANLRSHSRVHTQIRRYQCGTCGERFGYLNVLKAHELRHSGERPHACGLCDRRFQTKYNLKKHERTHTGERNYPCLACGKRFSQAVNLRTHLLRHSGVKAYACLICDMRFSIQSDLKKHQMAHTSEKPFKCQSCSKAFKSRNQLTVHTRIHTDERPYSCDICVKRFMTRNALKHHRFTHTGERPHRCIQCPRAFTQRGALNRHMKVHDKEIVTVEMYQDVHGTAIQIMG